VARRFSLLRYSESPEDLAVPVIDGDPLAEMLTDRYPGVALSLVVPPSRQWLGAPTRAEQGRAVILDGSCGYAGCCGVMAHIEVGPGTVVWSDFIARGSPRIPTGLRFEFDRAEYEASLAGLGTQQPLEWTDRKDWKGRTGTRPRR